MSVYNFDSLRQHVGHRIVCVEYGDKDSGVMNVALECEDCGEVLLDYDKPENRDYVEFSPRRFECPHCGYCSMAEDWNAATAAEFSVQEDEIVPLWADDYDSYYCPARGSDFACPNCGHVSKGEDIV